MTESAPHQTAVVIDDDPHVRALLVTILEAAGFTTIAVDNGLDGVDAVVAHRPVITTLDVNMPGIDGFEAARRIRAHSDTYIMLITALTDEADAVLGFSVGADDVIVKPFRPRELRARVLAAQRRRQGADGTERPTSAPAAGAADPASGQPSPPASTHKSTPPSVRGIGWNGLHLVRATHSTTVDGATVALTRTEFDLLATILEAAPEVRSKADLVRSLNDDPTQAAWVSDSDERSIETHIANLRRKLGDSASAPRFIETVRGAGYRAAAPAES
ncbi:response regulator transcription factor [Microbacterium invictum]|uniref:DNA-binding response OmpR family regulator n=1 Tax=Microbacterium invictum TaxID=515415 RepID=A0AA40VN69_9MICO|nr:MULTISPECIES: response regulator transcription factor [Microbacterium]MBB4140073.1 DNA-binding response OmpR family regulator [Microbacterium invictum]